MDAGTIAETVERIDSQIAAAAAERDAALAIAAEKRDTIKRLTRARAALVGDAPRRTRPVDPGKKAGADNVAKVEGIYRDLRKLTQAEAGKRLSMNSAVLSLAVRSLVRDGKLRPTGVKIGKSIEFEYISG